MSSRVVHKRVGTVEGWTQDVPLVPCGQPWVSSASYSDRLVSCKNCQRKAGAARVGASTRDKGEG